MTRYDPSKHHRRSVRLPGWDYRSPGAYFVTIATHGRECLFGEVVDGETVLSDFGRIVVEEWERTAQLRPYVRLDAFVVMPNHVHGVIWIVDDDTAMVGAQRRGEAPPRPYPPRGVKPGSLGAIVGSFKSAVTKRINLMQSTPGAPVWQRNYYEHIIRNEQELNAVRQYILSNPTNWQSDAENVVGAQVVGRAQRRCTPTLHIHNLLLTEYGDHPWHPSEPVASLVLTILSQNTNDVNRDRAYERLLARFPAWEQVRDAPEEELVEAIRPAGLAPTKAPRIQGALQRVTAERGEISLHFLAELPLEEARAWLLAIPGVGPKTAAIVLLFALGMPAFPVDTHVHRITLRLGLIPAKTSREKAHVLLEQLVPPELYYPFHLNLIEHGRAVCRARNPECARCALRDHCAHHASST